MSESKIHRFPWGTKDDAQVLIVHYGSKSTPLIAQLCREIGLMSQIVKAQDLPDYWHRRVIKPKFVILSGGDQSVYDPDALSMPTDIFAQMTTYSTVLGICYGAQLLAQLAGGKVEKAARAEFGLVKVKAKGFGPYRGGEAIMNHRDEITVLPPGWKIAGSTDRCLHALVGNGNVWGVQFHPEMDHTYAGNSILKHLAFTKARCARDYRFDPEEFVQQAGEWIEQVAPPGAVLCGLSGGVDSSVAFTIARASDIADRLRGIYVDTGFFREGETEEVRGYFGEECVTYMDASLDFYGVVEAIPYPDEGRDTDREYKYYEQVRKAIGGQFIKTFLSVAQNLGQAPGSLIQGTNYSDIIESDTGLKSHHNVGGLPDELGVSIIEPLAGLYKFEIRELASCLNLPREVVHRQPFPGPGLAIRTWGKLTRDDAQPLRRANRILEEVMREHYPDPEKRPCQYYVATAKLPSTGLVGDSRVIGYALWVRMVTARQRESYSTLGVFHPSWEFQEELTHRLVTEVTMPDGTPFVRVAYEITGKPPSTTEPH